MKTLLAVLALVWSVVSTANAAIDLEKLKAELVLTETEFFRYALEHGFNEGLRAYMADDGFIANGLTLGRDAQAAKARAEKERGTPAKSVIRWKPLRADVAASGDLGYTWGVAESGPTREGPFKPYGIYVTIWKRQADGKWKFVYDAATILAADALDKFLREQVPAVSAAASK